MKTCSIKYKAPIITVAFMPGGGGGGGNSTQGTTRAVIKTSVEHFLYHINFI